MSHKITINTQFTDENVLVGVLKDKGWPYSLASSKLTFLGGPLEHGNINLKTGKFRGDTDFHNLDKVHAFSQLYGEALALRRIAQENGYVESRQVMKDGTIRIIANVTSL